MFASLNLSQFPRIFEVLVILLLLLQDQKSKRPTDISGLLEFITYLELMKINLNVNGCMDLVCLCVCYLLVTNFFRP